MFFFSVPPCLCGLTLFVQAQEISLNQNWEFKKAGDTIWYPATVPGTVHTDLLANKLIPDPFYRDNESKVQWVENEDWEYQTFFDCDSDLLQYKHLELHFDGLDTYADVYLNDSLILRADNMFRSWNVDVTDIVTRPSGRRENEKRLESRVTGGEVGANHLFIHFYSAVKKGKELAAQLDYKLPGDESGKALERKAQYQFGWDWGARLVTCGVWKDVKLTEWDNYQVGDPLIIMRSLDTGYAIIRVLYDYKGKFPFSGKPIVYLTENYYRILANVIDSSQNQFYYDIKIERPVYWEKPIYWKDRFNTYPFVYELTPTILGHRKGDSSSIETMRLSTIRFGLRDLEVIQQPDSLGSSFYFQLNGLPLFIKGANVIPPDNFLPRVTAQDYKRLVDDAVACHMNMLRVWGGGAYLPDKFYDYCDEKGILIWQDFMFAGAMVPGDLAFIENVKQEAIDQVTRLRNHPCIALWCGNNEINEAWNNWGFQEENNLKPGVNEKIWNDYKRIFDTILPHVVHEYDPGRFYWESSPSIGWGHKEAFQQGDSHYWGVWWGEEPFSAYENHVGRFMSEYGFQALPSMDCFYEFASPDDWKQIPIDKKSASNVLNVHEKHSRGYEIINEYMQRDYKVPEDFEKYAYVSQLVQRDGIGTAIEAHRRAKPYCMGTLYWQLNDCWPVTSWSSVDYYGKWKALQYALKRDLYNTFLISIQDYPERFNVEIISDSSVIFEGTVKMNLISFRGDTIWSNHFPLDCYNTASNPFYTLKKDILQFDPHSTVLQVSFSDGVVELAKKNFFFAKPKDLSLPNPNLRSEIHYSKMKSLYEDYPNVYIISLHTDGFAKDIFLSYDFEDVKFSDNFFDLLPGEAKNVIMYSKEAIDEVHLPLKVISLRDSY